MDPVDSRQLMNPRANLGARSLVAIPLALLIVPALAVGIAATGLSWMPALAIALVIATILVFRVVPKFEKSSGLRRFLPWVWCAAMLGAVYFVADVSLFMADVSKVEHAYDPFIRPLDDEDFSPFYPKHNCFTAYVVAADLARARVPNVFEPAHYKEPDDSNPLVAQIATAFRVDRYQYPPPFLILPRALLATGGTYWQLRAYWHALNVSVLVLTLVILAVWLDRARFNIYWFLLPVVFLTPLLWGVLQIQNVHMMVIAISLLALPAFDARRNALGGALLGFCIVSKLFPGLLLVLLILQRRWRAAAWTIGWMFAFVLFSFALFGAQPFRAFVDYQLPRLASGEAFSFATTMTPPLLKNMSILGVVYKLGMLNVIADPKAIAPILVWTFTAILAGLLIVVGLRVSWSSGAETDVRRRCAGRLRLVRVWLAILVLGQLRSPFLPQTYGNMAVMMLVVVMLSARSKLITNVALAASLLLFAIPLPLPWGPAGVTPDLWFSLLGSVVTLVVVGKALLEGVRRIPTDQLPTDEAPWEASSA